MDGDRHDEPAPVDVSDGAGAAGVAAGGGRGVLGVLISEEAGSNGARWRVRFPKRDEPVAVPASALRRVPPARGEPAIAVLGDAAPTLGIVLSIDNGVAVLRTAEAKDAGHGPMEVRVMPLDALCRVEAQLAWRMVTDALCRVEAQLAWRMVTGK